MILFWTFPFCCVSLDFVHIREVENRARQAEKKFDDANEQLHFTLIRNKELEKELEEIKKSRKKELEGEEENEGERAEEEKEEDDDYSAGSSKPLQKGEACFLICFI